MRWPVTANVVVLGIALGCSGSSPPPTHTTTVVSATNTLYERLGGIDVLRSLVDAWMLEVASDSRIREVFVDADIARVKLRLVERLCVLTGGPCMYRGAELHQHHASLGIEERHMRAFLEDLKPAMKRAEIPEKAGAELREALLLLGAQIGASIGE
ncbi:MAG: group 1 truncated hemoglobin [Myxococcales bacterium]|nr:group 1 truncated hemoglobin [Myxococcales bacterium]